MAARRHLLLRETTALDVTAAVEALADAIKGKVKLPGHAVADATHIAIAAAYGLDFVLTWNCTHIANPAIERILRGICESHGYELPALVTPLNLMPIT